MISFINIFLLIVSLVLTGGGMNAESNGKTVPNHPTGVDSHKKEKTKKLKKSKPKKNGTVKLINQKGNWIPMKLVWDESSGAVAPEFRFAKQFQLVAGEKKITLSRRVIEKGKLVINESKEISPQIYQKWMESLFQWEINQLPVENSPKEQMTGVSYNFVSFQLGSTKSKFYYILEDRNQPEWTQKNSIIKIIERMKP
ncbi:permease [Leptospira sp. 85282-16]|uniref:permease n=1 Tax=Leptospira sp. 85282-16 TaxID=2971256 RepID=UPI0021BE071F|nr:permease [Leptospira sp. 85282-16]MCT8334463.1 permease [Leptospira sp. 85282-16]